MICLFSLLLSNLFGMDIDRLISKIFVRTPVWNQKIEIIITDAQNFAGRCLNSL
jgi:hypothetical protein